MGLLEAVCPVQAPWIAMMDTSIDIGTKKALVVLRIPLDALSKKGSAVTLSDCECIGLKVLERCDGETIHESLTAIFRKAGNPTAIVKDQGADLGKGVRLWKQAMHNESIAVINDIGHELANGLQAQYKHLRVFSRFLKIVRQGGARLRQTRWAFLIPPTLRIKGRFQSIGKLAQWGKDILTWLDARENHQEDEAMVAVRRAFAGLSGCRQFIEGFARTTQIVHSVLKLLKQHGLDTPRYEQCKQLAETLPQRSKVRKRLINWLERHRVMQSTLMSKWADPPALLVSTDIIESLFGKYKSVIERSPGADINRMALIIPALCGPALTPKRAEQLFSCTPHKDIEAWEKHNIPYTLRKKRIAFFEKIPKNSNQKAGN